MGNIGCEIQTPKCGWGAVGIKPKTPQEFYLDSKLLKEVNLFQYVGVWHNFNAKDMYAEHHRVSTLKAEVIGNACLAINRMVGGLSVWEARTLYMARVDPHLISAADICPDVVKIRRKEREDVQNHHLRRILGLNERSVIAVLFSETGLEPISYRRATLLLQHLKHISELGEDRLVKNGLLDSWDLAKQGKMSWVNDIAILLADLPIPVYWSFKDSTALEAGTIDTLIKQVKWSMETYIHTELKAYSRTRDLLPDRLFMEDGKWVHKVLAFRLYLRVRNHKHRVALTHAVLSGHALAMERMRWSERYKAQIPMKWRLCRFCKDHLEDAIHALFVCDHQPLVELRNIFYTNLFSTLPALHDANYTDPGLFFKDLLIKPEIIGLLGKLAYDIFEVFYSEPMVEINPAIFTPQN
jgi:hypothetical protein